MSVKITKVNAEQADTGATGQRYLARGENVAMRFWHEPASTDDKPERKRDYETVGYVVAGHAELIAGTETVSLKTGDSWTVPQGLSHTYRILQEFTAVEATYPAAREQNDAS